MPPPEIIVSTSAINAQPDKEPAPIKDVNPTADTLRDVLTSTRSAQAADGATSWSSPVDLPAAEPEPASLPAPEPVLECGSTVLDELASVPAPEQVAGSSSSRTTKKNEQAPVFADEGDHSQTQGAVEPYHRLQEQPGSPEPPSQLQEPLVALKLPHQAAIEEETARDHASMGALKAWRLEWLLDVRWMGILITLASVSLLSGLLFSQWWGLCKVLPSVIPRTSIRLPSSVGVKGPTSLPPLS